MDANDPPPIGGEELPATSLTGRLFNVFVAPGEAFDAIKQRPVATANWLVPMILLIIVGWITTGIINAQDFAQQQMAAMQEKGLQQQVESGKMTQQQADQAIHVILLVMKIVSYVGKPFGISAMLFLSGLVFWLLGTKALHGQFTFMKGVEAVGLVSIVGILSEAVRVSLVLIKGNLLASPSLVLFLKDPNPTSPLFTLLSVFNIFSFWWLGLFCIGLHRLSGATVARAATWVFGLWGAFTAAILGVGALVSRLGTH